MMPEEIQAILAKILFFIFAMAILCFGKARAQAIATPFQFGQQQTVQQIK